MSSIQNRIDAFAALGDFLSQFTHHGTQRKVEIPHNHLFFDGFIHQMSLAQETNPWYTKEANLLSIENWTKALKKKNLEKWISAENIPKNSSKTVAIVMAGNIPLVGFHDLLSVLISGHNVLVKQSSKDSHLMPFLAKYLEYKEPFFEGKIFFTQKKIEKFDAVIATGSTNTARYFKYYFRHKPHIIRKNRTSVAVISGDETKEDFENLSDDIFSYFGLGCRNVSKLFFPRDFCINRFFRGIYRKKNLINNRKYANNYDYNKAVYLMGKCCILENGFLLLKEDEGYASPIATVFYEYYAHLDDLKIIINNDSENIQCVIAKGFIEAEVPFGKSQHPMLWDYADGVNTLEFLSKI